MPKKKYTAAEREKMGHRNGKNKRGISNKEKQTIIYDDEIQPRKSANLQYQQNNGADPLPFDWLMAFVVCLGAIFYFTL